ncbi:MULTISPECIES: hypothetical protein [unclassified Rhizobium]|uniref:hypothetical protein n=1 Tax=unclassified Rhizobium TaxID=2613769 RepID=UPI0006FE942F|nr:MULTISPECIES: hypothetical protein [unclassified Rhizobium]KQV43600.1 hypothetical protein ASC86_01965 [Rhizobium sp. Root1212]KRD37784.1 hypothetical protein ASE37_01965 [Rhizobium sp. Root268]
MLKIFSIFRKSDVAAVIDLLDHPDIDRMDARALGDLPFPRELSEEEGCADGAQAKASVTLTSPTKRPFQLCMA